MSQWDFFFNYLCVFNLSLNQGQYNQEQTQSNKMAYSITGSTESRLASNPGSVHVCSHVRLFWDPINCSPPDSSVHGVFQARLLEWVTISYSRGSSWPRERNSVFCVSWNGRWILYQSTFWEDWLSGNICIKHQGSFPLGYLTLHSSFFSEKEMPTHSSILAWRIPWTEEPGGLLCMGLHRVRHDWSDLACMYALEKEMATHSSILAWRIPETEEPGGLLSMESHRVGHDWSDWAAAAAAAEVHR